MIQLEEAMDLEDFMFDSRVLDAWWKLCQEIGEKVLLTCNAANCQVPKERVRFKAGMLEIFVRLPNRLEITMPVRDGDWQVAPRCEGRN